MYPDISLWLSIVFMVSGLVLLAWSSDLFVGASATLARILGLSPFIVGMVVIGFGTSAPELCVSLLSGISDHSNLSLGNAYGSCVFNIAVILGVAAMIAPIKVKPLTALVAGPALAGIALFSMWVMHDGVCARGEAVILLVAFAVIMPLYGWFDQKTKVSRRRTGKDLPEDAPIGRTVLLLVAGLAWGAVDFARFMKVSDLLIGLTIVAAGTSLPELASAIASARRKEHEFVLGNIIGSNLFNMLAVVGLATVISPITTENGGFAHSILSRDLPLLAILSLSITLFGANWRHLRFNGRISRIAAAIWLVVFAAYATVMLVGELRG